MPLNPVTGTQRVQRSQNQVGAVASNPQPQESRGVGREFRRGIRRGVTEVGALAQEALAAGQAAVGFEDAARENLEEAEASRQAIAPTSTPRVGRIEDIRHDQGFDAFLDDTADYLAQLVGSQAPIIGTLAASGGVGTATARVAGVRGTTGAVVGVGGGSSAIETGSIFGNIARDPEAEGTLQEQAAVSGAGGLVAGSLDALPIFQATRRLGVADPLGRSLVHRAARAAVPQAATEAVTEAAQTVVERGTHHFLNRNFEVLGPDGVSEILNAAAAGAILGGGMGAVTGALQQSGPTEENLVDEIQTDEALNKTLLDHRIAGLRGTIDDAVLDEFQALPVVDEEVLNELDALTPAEVVEARNLERESFLNDMVQRDPVTALKLMEADLVSGNAARNQRHRRNIAMMLDVVQDGLNSPNMRPGIEEFLREVNPELADQLQADVDPDLLEGDFSEDAQVVPSTLRELEETRVVLDDVETGSMSFDEFEDFMAQSGVEQGEGQATGFQVPRGLDSVITSQTGKSPFFVSPETMNARRAARGQEAIEGAEDIDARIERLSQEDPTGRFEAVPARLVIEREAEAQFGTDPEFAIERQEFMLDKAIEQAQARNLELGEDPMSVFDGEFAVQRTELPPRVFGGDELSLKESDLTGAISSELRAKRARDPDAPSAKLERIRSNFIREVVRNNQGEPETRKNEFLINATIRTRLPRKEARSQAMSEVEEGAVDIRDEFENPGAAEAYIEARTKELVTQGRDPESRPRAVHAPWITKRMIRKLRGLADPQAGRGEIDYATVSVEEAAEAFAAALTSLRTIAREDGQGFVEVDIGKLSPELVVLTNKNGDPVMQHKDVVKALAGIDPQRARSMRAFRERFNAVAATEAENGATRLSQQEEFLENLLANGIPTADGTRALTPDERIYFGNQLASLREGQPATVGRDTVRQLAEEAQAEAVEELGEEAGPEAIQTEARRLLDEKLKDVPGARLGSRRRLAGDFAELVDKTAVQIDRSGLSEVAARRKAERDIEREEDSPTIQARWLRDAREAAAEQFEATEDPQVIEAEAQRLFGERKAFELDVDRRTEALIHSTRRRTLEARDSNTTAQGAVADVGSELSFSEFEGKQAPNVVPRQTDEVRRLAGAIAEAKQLAKAARVPVQKAKIESAIKEMQAELNKSPSDQAGSDPVLFPEGAEEAIQDVRLDLAKEDVLDRLATHSQGELASEHEEISQLATKWAKKLGLKGHRQLSTSAAVDILQRRRDVTRLQEIAAGNLLGLSIGESVWVSPFVEVNAQKELLAHEMGHATAHATQPKNDQQVFNAWKKWRRDVKKRKSTPAEARRTVRLALENIGNNTTRTMEELSQTDREYVLDFEEWFADQAADWLTGLEANKNQVVNWVQKPNGKWVREKVGKHTPKTAVDRWMNRFVNKINTLFTDAKRDGAVTDEAVQHFLERTIHNNAHAAGVVRWQGIHDARTINNNRLKPEDDLLVAIGKLGGIDRTAAEADGVDPNEFDRRHGGNVTFRKNGGVGFDEMKQRLEDAGFEFDETATGYNGLLDALSAALSGEQVFSKFGQDAAIEAEIAAFVESQEQQLEANNAAAVGRAGAAHIIEDPTSHYSNQAVEMMLRNGWLTGDPARALAQAFTGNTNITRKIQDLVRPHSRAEADAIGRDWVKAAAYGFQFWSAGNIKLGPKSQNAYERFRDTVLRAVGTVGDFEQARQVLPQVAEAVKKLQEIDSESPFVAAKALKTKGQQSSFVVHKVLKETRLQKIAQTHKEIWGGYLSNFAERIFVPAFDRIENLGIPPLTELARRFHTPPGTEGRGEGYLQARSARIGSWQDQLARALGEDVTEDLAADVLEALQQGKPGETTEVIEIVGKIRATFNEMRNYAVRSGVTMGDIPNYFPWVYDTQQLMDRKDEFIELLLQPQYSAAMESFLEQNREPGVIDTTEDVARYFHEQLTQDEGYADSGGLRVDRTGHIPFMAAMHERGLNFLQTMGTDESIALHASFFSKDLNQTLRVYSEQLVKRAEYTKQFGKPDPDTGRTQMDDLIDEARDLGATHEELQLVHDFVDAMQGTLGMRTNSLITRLVTGEDAPTGQIINPKLQTVFSATILWQNMRVLALATFTSLADPVGILVRGGSMDVAMASLEGGFSESHANRVAQGLGIIDTYTVDQALSSTYGTNFMVGRTRLWNERFFHWIMLSQLTRVTRGMATGGAMEFMLKHAEQDNATSRRFLAELGLESGADVVQQEDGQVKILHRTEIEALHQEGTPEALAEVARDQRVRAGIRRFVDEAILRPNAATRPIWASDPHYQLIFHLKSFLFTFHSIILRRVFSEGLKGNFTPLLFLTVFVPAMIAADWLRDLSRFGFEGDPNKADWGMIDHTLHGIQRSGIPGLGLLALDANKDRTFGGVGVESFLGPTAGSLRQVDDILLNENGNRWQAIVDQLPGQNTGLVTELLR